MTGHKELPNKARVLYEPIRLKPRPFTQSPERYSDDPHNSDAKGRTLLDLVEDQIHRGSTKASNQGKDWGRMKAALKRCNDFMDFCIYDFDDDEKFSLWQEQHFLPELKKWFDGNRPLGRRTAHDYVSIFCKWMRRHGVNIEAVEDLEKWNQCRLWDKSLKDIAPLPKDKKRSQFTDEDILIILDRITSLLENEDAEPLIHECDVTAKGTPKRAGPTILKMLRAAIALSLNMTPRPAETKGLRIGDLTAGQVRRLIRKPTSGTYGETIAEVIWPETKDAVEEYLKTKKNRQGSTPLFPKGAALEKWFRSLLKDTGVYRDGWMNLHRFRTYDLSKIAKHGGTHSHLMASGGFTNLASVSTYIDEITREKHIIEANIIKRDAFEEIGILEAISTTKQIVDEVSITRIKHERTIETAAGIIRESMEYHNITWSGPKYDLVSGPGGEPTLVPQDDTNLSQHSPNPKPPSNIMNFSEYPVVVKQEAGPSNGKPSLVARSRSGSSNLSLGAFQYR